MEPFVIAESEFLHDRKSTFETATLTLLNRVLVISDTCGAHSEFAPALFISP